MKGTAAVMKGTAAVIKGTAAVIKGTAHMRRFLLNALGVLPLFGNPPPNAKACAGVLQTKHSAPIPLSTQHNKEVVLKHQSGGLGLVKPVH
jgi:hypothetical protein